MIPREACQVRRPTSRAATVLFVKTVACFLWRLELELSRNCVSKWLLVAHHRIEDRQ
jgi:hypothetical protein